MAVGESRSRWSGAERRSVIDDDISRLPVELSRLHEIAAKITTGQELSDVLANLARVAAEEAWTDKSAVFLLDDEGVELRLKAHMGLPDAFVERLLNTRLGYGAWGLAAMKSRVVIAERLENDSVTAVERDLYRRAGIKSAWAVPLVGRDDQVIGAFAVFYTGYKRPSRRDVFMAQLYGFHASMAIENAWLHEQLRAQANKGWQDGSLQPRPFPEHIQAGD